MLWVSNWRSLFLTANAPHHLPQAALPTNLDMAYAGGIHWNIRQNRVVLGVSVYAIVRF